MTIGSTIDSTHQTCGTCGETKPLTQAYWHRRPASPNGWRGQCRDCRRAVWREQRARKGGPRECRQCGEVYPNTEEHWRGRGRTCRKCLARPDKRCATCREWKPKTEFCKHKRNADRLDSYCGACKYGHNRRYADGQDQDKALRSPSERMPLVSLRRKLAPTPDEWRVVMEGAAAYRRVEAYYRTPSPKAGRDYHGPTTPDAIISAHTPDPRRQVQLLSLVAQVVYENADQQQEAA